ncbi:MAG: hypothetical protein WC634_03560 [archaeon]
MDKKFLGSKAFFSFGKKALGKRALLLQCRAQISVELIIILAAVVALVLLLVSQLQQTSEEGTKVIEEKSKKIFEEIEGI